MVDFYKDWYNNLIAHSNEKDLLVERIAYLLKGKTHNSCLEIGLGTSAYFAEKLGSFFEQYSIVEKNEFSQSLPQNVTLIHDDFEKTDIKQKFDVIIASHVVYYFKDLSKAVKKIMNLLEEGGRAYFVVNGKESDYGPIKEAFAGFIDQEPYNFTYDILKSALKKYLVKEYTTQASLSFNSYEDLYEALKLSFDLYPKEYKQNKQKVITWLQSNIKGDKFFIDQKIIEVSNNTWKTLIEHEQHNLSFENAIITVENGVFTPDPSITYSPSIILENLPPLKGKCVADVGTGTGILAIKAALEGAEVVATDISELAIQNALSNIAMNAVHEKVTLVKTNLLDGIDGPFDFIFANIPILDEVWDAQAIKVQSTAEILLLSAKEKLTDAGKIFIPWGSFAEDQRKNLEDLIVITGYKFQLQSKDCLGYTWYLYTLSK